MKNEELLEAISEAASCYIPIEELTEEQQEKLLNIRIKLCDCDLCKSYSKQPGKIIAAGHAIKKTYEIGISEHYFNALEGTEQTGCVPVFLLEEIMTVLHEIIHVLFPDLSEKQTRRRTKAWLKRSIWLQHFD